MYNAFCRENPFKFASTAAIVLVTKQSKNMVSSFLLKTAVNRDEVLIPAPLCIVTPTKTSPKIEQWKLYIKTLR